MMILLMDLWHVLQTLAVWFLVGCMVAPMVYAVYLAENRGEK